MRIFWGGVRVHASYNILLSPSLFLKRRQHSCFKISSWPDFNLATTASSSCSSVRPYQAVPNLLLCLFFVPLSLSSSHPSRAGPTTGATSARSVPPPAPHRGHRSPPDATGGSGGARHCLLRGRGHHARDAEGARRGGRDRGGHRSHTVPHHARRCHARRGRSRGEGVEDCWPVDWSGPRKGHSWEKGGAMRDGAGVGTGDGEKLKDRRGIIHGVEKCYGWRHINRVLFLFVSWYQ